MDEIRQEFLDIVAQVRTHLEYQRTLGVRMIELPLSAESSRGEARHDSNPPQSTFAKGGTEEKKNPSLSEGKAVEEVPPLQKESAGGLAAVQPSTLDAVREELGDCRRCKLATGRSTIVFGEGNPKAVLVFVGEGPGYEEDQQGRPFVGAAGQLLTDIIVKGMKLAREDVYICNIVKCRPPNNRNPEPDEVDACIGFVKKQIAAIQPSVIVTLGNVPTQSLLGTKQGITKLRGTWQEYNGIPVMPTFHPSYLLRSPGEKGKAWEDIKLVMVKLGMPVPEKK